MILKKRALAVSKICDFIEREIGCQFPCSESDYYMFLRSERSLGAPVSRRLLYSFSNVCRYFNICFPKTFWIKVTFRCVI